MCRAWRLQWQVCVHKISYTWGPRWKRTLPRKTCKTDPHKLLASQHLWTTTSTFRKYFVEISPCFLRRTGRALCCSQTFYFNSEIYSGFMTITASLSTQQGYCSVFIAWCTVRVVGVYYRSFPVTKSLLSACSLLMLLLWLGCYHACSGAAS